MPDTLQDALLPPDLEKQLANNTNLPSLPVIAVKIIEASKDPDVSLRDVASIISADPAISAKLLKIANSPLYSQRRAINNLREALTLLGFNAALTIALSFSLFHSLKVKGHSKCNHDNYWKRSILSAQIARLLGQRFRLSKLEDLFLVGLLQDIGILALENLNPPPYVNYDKMCIKHTERISIERKILKLEHSCVGAWLLNSWNFPATIVNAVLHSHSLSNHMQVQDKAASQFHLCLSFSGTLADMWLEENPTELFQSTLEAAGLALNIDADEFSQLVAEINKELLVMSALFDVNFDDEIQQGQILEEAREVTLLRSIHFIKQSENDQRQIENIAEQVKEIEKESQRDYLTKVYNRKHFERLLKDEYENANINRWPLSIAFIDIDNFKEINDSHGHLIGDKIIIAIADFFSENIRQTDILARYGGDEFILMLPGSTTQIAEEALNRLITLLRKSIRINTDDRTLTPTVSVGLASHMDINSFPDVESFIRAADKALYKAKGAGRNCLAVY